MKRCNQIFYFSAIILGIIGTITSCTSVKNSGSEYLNFDQILIYEFQIPTDPHYPEQKELIGKSIDDSIKNSSFFLEIEEVNKFKEILSLESSYNDNAAICWEPHIGVFFLRKDLTINYIEISLNCNRIMSAKEIKFLTPKAIDGLKVPRGISPEFRDFIKTLMKKYHFNHRVPTNTRYD